jgi:hypothetical protein
MSRNVTSISTKVTKYTSRSFSHSRFLHAKPFARPSPPPLPAEDQKEFEELVRKAQAPLSTSSLTKEQISQILNEGRLGDGKDKTVEKTAEALVERHPDARKPLPVEFEGNVNPVTGEQGGPKQEPLKHGDWSFGGRVTDF